MKGSENLTVGRWIDGRKSTFKKIISVLTLEMGVTLI
jgi:hypothetical protein